MNGTNMNLIPGTSEIIFSNTGGMINSNGNNLDYYNVFFSICILINHHTKKQRRYIH